VWLPHDRQTVFVSFTGGARYDASNACSTDYAGWAHGRGDTLEVAIVEVHHQEQAVLGPNMACTMMGFGYSVELRLPVPFEGGEIVDRGSGPLWVPEPEAVADLHELPPGWWFYRPDSEPESRTLIRTYHPDPIEPWPPEREILLAQAFDGRPNPFGDPLDGARAGEVSIHGQQVQVSGNPEAGLTVRWTLGTNAMALMLRGPVFTIEMLEAMANGVAVPKR
jgi:hypothetical protein